VVVMRGTCPLPQHGLTLIELVIAIAIGSLLLAGLNSIVMIGLRAQAPIEAANEQVYRAGFALERIVARTRAAPLKTLAGAPVDSTADWLAPVMFCRVSASQTLRETTTSDTTCAGGTAVAEGVTAFSMQRVTSTRPVDLPVVTVSLTVSVANSPQAVVLTQSVRLAGGAL
jgi:prepilin-type N-terminal cleavage/methylation domain-containing protein